MDSPAPPPADPAPASPPVDPAPAPPPAGPPRGPAPAKPIVIPPGVRWLMIVVLPALGFLLGAFVVFFYFTSIRSVAALWVVSVLVGSLGAALALAAGLVAVPWLPAGAEAPGADDHVPAAPHPDGLSWLGPGAALLVGVGVGVALGPALLRERSYRLGGLEPYTVPALVAVVCAALGVGLLLAHARHGPEALPAGRAPLHRVVFRCLLRGAVGGLLAGVAGFVMMWLFAPTSTSKVMKALGPGLLGAAALGATLTAAEVVSWRVPFAWRWPALLLGGLLLPLGTVLGVGFAVELFRGGDAMFVTQGVLSMLIDTVADDPDEVLGVLAGSALPFALLAAARTGLLPYFGRRAPWPLLAQVPLAWLAGVVWVALLHLLVKPVNTRDLTVFLPYLAGALPALLVGLRLADPLERRIASRWVLLTGGGRD